MQVIISRFDNAEDRESNRVLQIKEKAGKIIEDRVPAWKQRNLISKATELLHKASSEQGLTLSEEAEIKSIQEKWDEIKNVRKASNLAEEQGTPVRLFNP